MSNNVKQELEIIAARIGSPWGGGATYNIDRASTFEDVIDDGYFISHLSDNDRELFINDVWYLINQQVVQALEKIKGALPDTNDDNQFSPDGAGGWDLESYKLGIDDAVYEIDNLIKEYKGDKG